MLYPNDFNSSIEFQDVSFTYESGNKPAIQNINLKINKGSYIALIGESGAGKSTTIDLIMRFYDPNDGNILLDGVNLKDISKQSLRKQIGIVPQDIILFNDTVKNNISYGFQDVNINDIKDAAKAAPDDGPTIIP